MIRRPWRYGQAGAAADGLGDPTSNGIPSCSAALRMTTLPVERRPLMTSSASAVRSSQLIGVTCGRSLLFDRARQDADADRLVLIGTFKFFAHPLRADQRNAAGEFGNTLLPLLLVVVGGGLRRVLTAMRSQCEKLKAFFRW